MSRWLSSIDQYAVWSLTQRMNVPLQMWNGDYFWNRALSEWASVLFGFGSVERCQRHLFTRMRILNPSRVFYVWMICYQDLQRQFTGFWFIILHLSLSNSVRCIVCVCECYTKRFDQIISSGAAPSHDVVVSCECNQQQTNFATSYTITWLK